jgi:hypothetical protein
MGGSLWKHVIGCGVLMATVSAACAPPSEPAAGPEESSLRIQVVDFFGLRRVTPADARAAMALKEGDTISLSGDSRPVAMDESERRLKQLAGVANAHLTLVCCEAGGGIVYVSVQEHDALKFNFRSDPKGAERLPPEVVKAGEQFIQALSDAVRRGDSAEDLWNGQAVMRDPAARSVQMQFISWAREPDTLRRVLRNSSDVSHRALAAHILGHAADQGAVIQDLVDAMSDSSEEVRNNAMRALAVIARAQADAPKPVRIPPEPFVAMLESPVWSDRNKASLALMELTATRDPALLRYLRRQARGPLTEMARWKSAGHALPAFMILGRMADRTDEQIHASWEQGRREELIGLAQNAGSSDAGRVP